MNIKKTGSDTKNLDRYSVQNVLCIDVTVNIHLQCLNLDHDLAPNKSKDCNVIIARSQDFVVEHPCHIPVVGSPLFCLPSLSEYLVNGECLTNKKSALLTR